MQIKDILRGGFAVLILPLMLAACDTDSDFGQYQGEFQASDDSFTVSEDEMFAGDVSTNDSLGAGRTYSVGTPPSNGVLTLSADGAFTYMPNPDYFGSDSFTVNVTYAGGETSSSTANLTIEDVPDTLGEWGWSMVWSDEFDGVALDPANWTPQVGDGSDVGLTRWGNNELQWYQEENIRVEDGNLVISARAEEVVPTFPYTSGRMRSIDKVDIKYGRIEARVKTPTGQGLWSAFWMLPTDTRYGGWAASGEIDIMEVINAGTAAADTFGTLHYGFPWPLNQQNGKPIEVAADEEFHVYAIEWEQDEIRWYIDNEHYHTVRSDHWLSYYYGGQDTGYVDGPDGAPFDVEFHILLNLAVGGFLPGTPDAATVFPAEMLVDYVRVYECTADTASGVGCASWVDEDVQPAPAKETFIASYDLYTDGAGAFSWEIGGQTFTRDLAFNSFWDNGGSLTFGEVAAADPARGNVLQVITTNSGNISFYTVDGEPIQLFGMGNNPNWWEIHAGELKFDIYIDSAGTDVGSSLLIKMDSGWPALGFVDLPIADLPLDEWTTVSVRVNDLIFQSGDQPLNTNAVMSVFVLEPTGMASVQLDNIKLVCGHPADNGCGVTPPSVDIEGDTVNVFIDDVDPVWTNGIGAWDTIAGQDYFDPASGNHVSWALVDTGEAGHDTVLEVSFAADTADGLVYIQSASGIDMSSFNTGNLVFDLRLPADATHGITFKVDCGFPCSSGDQVLNGVVPGDWQTFEIPIASLRAAGLDTTKVNTGIVIFPTWGQQQGVSFQLDNVRWEVDGGAAPPPPDAGGVSEVYIDAPNPPWSLWDCCGGSTPEQVQDEDPARGMVAQYTYNNIPTVAGFEASTALDLSAYAGGTLEFDLYLDTAPTNTSGQWLLKIEGQSAATPVEVPLTTSVEGVEPPLGEWQHYTFDLDTLVNLGFNLGSMKLVMVFPTWGTGDGAVVRLDNVVFNPAP